MVSVRYHMDVYIWAWNFFCLCGHKLRMCLLSEKLSVKFLPPSDIFYSIFFVITVLQQTQDHPRTFDKSLMAFYKIKKNK